MDVAAMKNTGVPALEREGIDKYAQEADKRTYEQGLEDAAKVCESVKYQTGTTGDYYAERIRALKEKP